MDINECFKEWKGHIKINITKKIKHKFLNEISRFLYNLIK